jgi:transposase
MSTSSRPCQHTASSRRRYAGWTIERIRKDAASIGPATGALCDLILDARAHPEQGFRACLGIIRLARPGTLAYLNLSLSSHPNAR